MAKKKKAKGKKSLKHHSMQLHKIGKKYMEVTKKMKIHSKKRKDGIITCLKNMEKSINRLIKLESR